MLRIHFIQHGFNLADFACKEALYDITNLRHFAGIDLGCEGVPDATTLFRFRCLLEKHILNEQRFAEVGRVRQGSGTTLETDTIVNATLIAAPSSKERQEETRSC